MQVYDCYIQYTKAWEPSALGGILNLVHTGINIC